MKIYIFYLINIVFSLSLWAQGVTKTRNECWSAKVNQQCQLQMVNKYGNIHFHNWEKDSVKIDATLIVNAKNNDRLNKLYNYIDFEFLATQYYITIKTVFKNYSNTVWYDFATMAESLINSGNALQVNYNVYLPEYLSLKIDNKFGNIYSSNHSGKYQVQLSNGDIKINVLKGDADIHLTFGNFTLNNAMNAELNLSYAEAEIRQIEKANIECKSSRINIDESKQLKINSRRDKIKIKNCKSIDFTGNFSNLTIDNLNSDIIFNAKYGDVNINQISSTVSLLQFNTNYTDVNLIYASKWNGIFLLRHNIKSYANLPSFITVGKKENTGTSKEPSFLIEGTIGNGNANQKTDILLNAGSLNLFSK